MRRLLLSALVCGLLTLPATADLVQNGSFETGVAVPSGSYLSLDAGDSTSITGWTVVGTGGDVIDYINGLWTASDGTRSLDLNGAPGPGGVAQILSTTAGETYIVTFDMAGNPWPAMGNPGPTTMTMDVSAGTTTDSFTFDTTGHNFTSMGWETKEFVFTADSSSTTLLFMSTTSNVNNPGYGPALDNVSVNLVPIPGAVLLGMLGLGAAGVRLRRFA
ncbi:MAG: choice-of-anchor C family protein [Sedimentisphaerales bacterium]|nr:choice-of-anchor C family protein [Sedimentisphaerales bacterium]